MAILSGIPVLNCQSIESTLDFYQSLLQFVIVKKRESEGLLQWVHLMHGDTTLMLQRSESLSQKVSFPESAATPQANINLYFFVNNLSELHHFIKVNYGDVSDIISTDYRLQEFRLVDPEGNTVIVGMSVSQLSADEPPG